MTTISAIEYVPLLNTAILVGIGVLAAIWRKLLIKEIDIIRKRLIRMEDKDKN